MIYSKKIVYDDSDNLVEIGDYDSSGALVKDYDFFALIDEYADENDTQVVLMKAYFDDNHNQISQEYYDAMGQLTVDTDTNYAAVVKMTYKNGLLQSTKRYDENGYPLITDGYCGQRYTYDENGYISTVTFTDDKGMPAKSEAYGYVTEKRVNDDRGNPIEAEYLDGFGKTLDTALGYAKIEMEYNKRNQKVREIYYNADGTRSDLGGMGISETRCEYNDEFGRQTLVSYFDADGNPAVSPVDADAHKAVIVYTEGDFVDTVEYKKYTIDSRLLKIRKKIYQNGMLVSDKIYDAEGNLMRVVYDTEFTNTSDTRKSIMKAYNEQGVIETLTEMEFTVDGIPVKRVDCSYYDYLSDKLKDKQITECHDTGVVKKTCLEEFSETGDTEASTEVIYDTNGRYTEFTASGSDENGEYRYEGTLEYTDEGSYCIVERYDEDNKISATIEREYYANGTLRKSIYSVFGEDGNKSEEWVYEYDEQSNPLSLVITEWGILKKEGIIIYNSDGSMDCYEKHWDSEGNVIFTDSNCFDKDGNLIEE